MSQAMREQLFAFWMIGLTLAGPVISVIFWRRGKQRVAAKVLIVLGILFLLEPGACLASVQPADVLGLMHYHP